MKMAAMCGHFYFGEIFLLEPLSLRERGRGEGATDAHRMQTFGLCFLHFVALLGNSFPHPNPLPEGEGARVPAAQNSHFLQRISKNLDVC
jgi:hypothetical protein